MRGIADCNILSGLCDRHPSLRRNAYEPNDRDLAKMMNMLHHDEAALVHDLAQVGIRSRVAFAASCAERLFPAYVAFCERAGRGDRITLGEILERVWQHLRGDEMSIEQLHAELSRCMALIPGEDDEPWVDEQPYAEDAASAIAYTLRALDSGEPQEAAWAARCAYEAADHHVMHRLGVEGEPQILAHPVIQAEFSRQRGDLDELLGAGQESAELFIRLRERARMDAPTFFASGS
jgi:uncharacterized protein YjaG (DUF416 family)